MERFTIEKMILLVSCCGYTFYFKMRKIRNKKRTNIDYFYSINDILDINFILINSDNNISNFYSDEINNKIIKEVNLYIKSLYFNND